MNASPYSIELELFEGPLDLLLYLIKKQDMNIEDIPICEITQEYLSHITAIQQLNLEVAGEFLVMASTLMLIKSKMLLPSTKKEEGEDEVEDPRVELVSKLVEYKKYKEASKFLKEKETENRDVFFRNILPKFPSEELTLKASLIDLVDAFKMVLQRADDSIKELLYIEIPIEQKIREILDRLEEKQSVSFFEIFASNRSRHELIVTFLALLELIRIQQVMVRQNETLGEIWVHRIENEKDPTEKDTLVKKISPELQEKIKRMDEKNYG